MTNIYLLRHEQRESSPRFMSSLTPTGFAKLPALYQKLQDLNIQVIYSSPFLRTLQTIYKFAKYNHLKIRVEYALYEHYNIPSRYMKYSVHRLLIDYPYLFEVIEPCYTSFIKYDQLDLKETLRQKTYRIKSFMDHLLHTEAVEAAASVPPRNILIVTHRDVIDTLMNIDDQNIVQPGNLIKYHRP